MSTQQSDFEQEIKQNDLSSLTSEPFEFATMDYAFDTMIPSYALDSENHQPSVIDNPIMWGGMQQLSLDKDMAQQWSPGPHQDMYDPQLAARHYSMYGQITPPEDKRSGMTRSEIPQEVKTEAGVGAESQETVATLSDKATKPKRTDSKRRARDGEEQQQGKSKKSTRKARKGYKALTIEDEFDSDGEMKRERFLERNRVAASKCRQKKKVWTNGLESHARSMAAANAHLNACALSLREEVLYLKSECLKHTDCNCTRIREYLDRSIAGMAPSNVLNDLSHHDAPVHRKPSEDSVYTFASISSTFEDSPDTRDLPHHAPRPESQDGAHVVVDAGPKPDCDV